MGSVWHRLSASILTQSLHWLSPLPPVVWQIQGTYSVRMERSWAMALSGSAGASPDGTLQSQR